MEINRHFGKTSATHIDTHHIIINRSITTQAVKLTENFGMIFAKNGTYRVSRNFPKWKLIGI
jgi:hypothetical protein